MLSECRGAHSLADISTVLVCRWGSDAGGGAVNRKAFLSDSEEDSEVSV